MNSRGVLAKLMAMPLSIWNNKVGNASIRHIGPTAQDFYSTFGIGHDDTHIAAFDTNDVALAAIQGLYQENQELKEQNTSLEARLTNLEQNAQPAMFNWFNLSSVIAFAGFMLNWNQQRRSKQGQA